ncbi:serine/arginine repetitive matrix protein 2 [Streptomyces sp. NPDC090109]|uniref:serine/arginine repetitive matrix protein 2 n=1 Tax=Streptomyces sp. NPDC090109 TaxID=3365948 RepID=UPI00381705D7
MSGYGGGGGGGARWNDATQSWETDAPGAGPAPAPGPVGGSGPLLPPLPPPPPPSAPEHAPEYGSEHTLAYETRYGPGAGAQYGPEHGPEHGPRYVPETGTWQYAPPPPPRSSARAAVVAGVVAAAVAAGSVAGWMLWGGDDGKAPAAGPPASVSASDPAPEEAPPDTPAPSPSTTATPTDDVPPPGYRAVKDLKSFTIAIPEDWHRTESDQGVFYNAPNGRSLLQVFVVTEDGLTPYDALRGTSRDGRANKPGYEEISLERITGEPDAPADTAELVYAYDRDGGRRKVVDRAFTAADGNHYAILAAGPEEDWPKQREVLRVALEFFEPGPY